MLYLIENKHELLEPITHDIQSIHFLFNILLDHPHGTGLEQLPTQNFGLLTCRPSVFEGMRGPFSPSKLHSHFIAYDVCNIYHKQKCILIIIKILLQKFQVKFAKAFEFEHERFLYKYFT